MKSLYLPIQYVALSLIITLVGFFTLNSFALAQSSGSASSGEPTREQVVASLNEALAEISASIASSQDVSAQERIGLYLDLIEVSRAILSIQTINRGSGRSAESDNVRPEGALTREEANLYKVAAQLDSETFEAELTYYYTEDLAEIEDGSVYVEYEEEAETIQLDVPTEEIMSFEERVENATLQIIDAVVRETNVLYDEVAQNVHVSSYNPIRDVRQPRENRDSYSQLLFDDFEKHSIIEEITVFTSGNAGTIHLESDQEQDLYITLSRNLPEQRGGRGGDGTYVHQDPEDIRYSFAYAFYSTSINQEIERERGEDPVVVPTLEARNSDVNRDQILEILEGFFGEMPFSQGIEEISERTLDFLVNNTAYILYDEETAVHVRNPRTHSAQCISDSDVLVMNEVLLQLIEAVRGQFIVSEEAIQYHVPLRPGRVSNEWRCDGVQDFF